MMVSNLAIIAAMSGAQPVCEPGQTCPEQADAPVVVAAQQQETAEEPPLDDNAIVVTGELEAPAGDPAEELNAATFEVAQAVDEAVVAPIAEAYDEGVPKPIRKGLRNALRNLGEPINFLNFLLQLKPGKALKSAGRFVINTTVGIGGLMDVASKKPFHLEHEANGLANTLGYYGVGPGPYLYLPFIGSTTLRDLTGRIVDLSIIPNIAGKPFNRPIYAIPVGTLTSLESRIEIDGQIDTIRERCGDPYSATRDTYMIQRQLEIDALRGRESSGMEELVERLEFNCDINILLSGAGGVSDPTEFIEERTNLLDGESPYVYGEGEEPGAGVTNDEGVSDAASAVGRSDENAPVTDAIIQPPAIRFVSTPVVQPIQSGAGRKIVDGPQLFQSVDQCSGREICSLTIPNSAG